MCILYCVATYFPDVDCIYMLFLCETGEEDRDEDIIEHPEKEGSGGCTLNAERGVVSVFQLNIVLGCPRPSSPTSTPAHATTHTIIYIVAVPAPTPVQDVCAGECVSGASSSHSTASSSQSSPTPI